MAYYHKKKSNVGAVVGGSIAFLLLLALVGGVAYKSEGFKNWDVKEWFNFNKDSETTDKEEGSSSNVESTVSNSQNMAIRMMAKTVNQDGSVSLSYSYTITPNNATRKQVTGALSFVDGTEGVGNYLEFAIDNELQTFTITKKADFNKQAQLVLTCVSANNVNATILIDCKQAFLGYANVSEKAYKQVLDASHDIDLLDIRNDLAHDVGADNVSNLYSIALPTFADANNVEHPYKIQSVSYTLTGYAAGDTLEGMVDSGLTIDNTFALYGLDLSQDLTLTAIQNVVSSDSALMTEQQRQLFESKEYFGIAYDMEVTYKVLNQTKVATAHILGAADVDDLTFGVVPNGMTVEDDHVIFNETAVDTDFSITADAGSGKGIFVVGAFNNWTVSTDYRMTWGDGNVWTKTIALEPGTYEYKFVLADYETGANADYDTLNAQNRSVVVQ